MACRGVSAGGGRGRGRGRVSGGTCCIIRGAPFSRSGRRGAIRLVVWRRVGGRRPMRGRVAWRLIHSGGRAQRRGRRESAVDMGRV